MPTVKRRCTSRHEKPSVKVQPTFKLALISALEDILQAGPEASRRPILSPIRRSIPRQRQPIMKHPRETSSRFPLTSLRILAASLLVAGLTACGGGGGDNAAVTSAKSFKGTVTAYNSPQSFSIDGVPVDASGSSTAPQGLTTGSRVEVQGDMVNGTLQARRVELEDDHDGDDNGTDSSELEGRVTAYTSPTSFSVDGIPVDATAAPTPLSVGVHVEIHGSVTNGVMVAIRVQLEGSGSDDGQDDEKDDGDRCDPAAKSSCPDDDSDDDGVEDEDTDDDSRR